MTQNPDKTQTQDEQFSTGQAAHSNPFENSRPVADEINESKEELENEQMFKEAQTERD